MDNSIAELERCVNDYGFVGCNLNPDPSGGFWNGPELGGRYWYPFYEKMCELDVPAMIHVSAACNPNFHTTGSHYLGADTTAFMQMLTSDLLLDFPSIKFIIPHGGGAVPYHWGRFRGLVQAMANEPSLEELVLGNVYFDTCVYHQPGIDLLLDVIPAENILFASELLGAVRGGGSAHRPQLRRHEALRRCLDQCIGRRESDDLRGQRAAGLFAPQGMTAIPCSVIRGGTSRGAYFLASDLPIDPAPPGMRC